MDKSAKTKQQQEMKIKDLEAQIEMLKNQSGDLVNQLQAKIKQMTEDHEEGISNMEKDHSD